MPGVVLVFRGLSKQPLGDLGEVDARTLAEELLAGPSLAGNTVANKIRAALKHDASDGQVAKVVLNEMSELDVIHQACSESRVMQGVPSFERLCAEVAKTRAGL